jgi:hypothetical protein
MSQLSHDKLLGLLTGEITPTADEFRELILALDNHRVLAKVLALGFSFLFLSIGAVERFYDKVKNTKNIQVLTFCQDYDYARARLHETERAHISSDRRLGFDQKAFPGGGEGVWRHQFRGTTVVPLSILEFWPRTV